MTTALEQHDFVGSPVFHHRTGAGWMVDGANPDSGVEPLETRCRVALAELRSRWDGRVLPDPTPPQGTDGPNVFATRRYLFRRIGVDERFVTFRPDERAAVESGGDPGWLWRLGGERRARELILADPEAEVARLFTGDDCVWLGRWHGNEPMALELLPAALLSN
jgi:hypothetical protein